MLNTNETFCTLFLQSCPHVENECSIRVLVICFVNFDHWFAFFILVHYYIFSISLGFRLAFFSVVRGYKTSRTSQISVGTSCAIFNSLIIKLDQHHISIITLLLKGNLRRIKNLKLWSFKNLVKNKMVIIAFLF